MKENFDKKYFKRMKLITIEKNVKDKYTGLLKR